MYVFTYQHVVSIIVYEHDNYAFIHVDFVSNIIYEQDKHVLQIKIFWISCARYMYGDYELRICERHHLWDW